jgi:iron complex outermembrane receptor protein
MIEEDFMMDQNLFSDFKFRFGWGRTGNQEIPNKITLASVGGNDGTRAVLDGNSFTPGLTFLRTPNPDLKWEQTDQLNIGVDMGFMDDRIVATFDYFQKTTTDMLLEITAPAPSTATTIWTNVDGELVNSGLEAAIGATVLQSQDFSWDVNVNATFLSNEVNGLPVSRIETGAASGQGLSGTQVQIITNGQPLGTFFGRVWTGRDADGNDTYKLDEDGNAVRENLGSAIPDFTWGLSQTFKYKRWDANVFINGAHGHQVYNNTFNSIINKPSLRGGNNVTQDILTSDESFTNILSFSSRFIEDGDFIRLNNVTIGYNVDVTNIEYLSRLRLYATGTNLLLFTNYTGYDPEVNTGAASGGVPSLGVDFTNFPRPRTFMVGVNMSF